MVETHKKELDEKSKALKKVQDIVQHYHIDIRDIFTFFDKDKGGYLDDKEFHEFLCKIDPSLTYIETNSVFTKVDKSSDGKISL